MTQYKVPGVYIVEKDAFPNSVVEVATAVPAFIGYTEKAIDANQPLKLVPWLIESMADYKTHFGGQPKMDFTYPATTEKGATPKYSVSANSRFLLYYSLRLYFENGGGPCYIVSTGDYNAKPSADDFIAALAVLERQPEPTMLVAPDVVGRQMSAGDASKLPALFLAHCDKMQSRVAIFDVPDGDKLREQGTGDQITNFRTSVNTDFLNYGMAYYPWLNAQIVDTVDFRAISAASMGAFAAALTKEAQGLFSAASDKPKLDALTAKIGDLTKLVPPPPEKTTDSTGGDPSNPADTTGDKTPAAPSPAQITALHQVLTQSSLLYVQTMNDIMAQLNLLPPSGAIAGVYCRIDSTQGVFKAPANTGLNSVAAPTVNLSDYEQEDLNMPLDGKAVNAIRGFRGRGTIVWGARTLDGNSQDWRYINVRRTLIMLEQSIKYAMQPYVFAPNTAMTWVTVQNMIENFLTNQWKAGALVGSKATDAFTVAIGQPATMTADDILNGLMKVLVKVAPVRPAEFIELTFQQQQAS